MTMQPSQPVEQYTKINMTIELNEENEMLTNLEVAQEIDQTYIIRGATMNDLEKAVELFNICAEAMIGKPEAELEDIRNDWLTPGFDLEGSTRVVIVPDGQSNGQATGQMIGYVEVWDINSVPVTPWVWGRVHPDFEGLGIGTRLLTWAEARARRAIPRVPDGARVAMLTGTISTYHPPKRLFERLGMTVIRQFYDMVIELDKDIPEPKWPENIQLRTFAEVPDLTAVFNSFDEAFKDHWGHVEGPVDEELERWRHWIENDKEFDPTLWFLAMDGDEIAAVSLCRPKLPEDAEMGHVNVLGVRRQWRRQGLALALLHQTFGEFRQRGQKRVSLGVDATSLTGANQLYVKAGMHVYRQFDSYEKVLRPGKDLSLKTLEE